MIQDLYGKTYLDIRSGGTPAERRGFQRYSHPRARVPVHGGKG